MNDRLRAWGRTTWTAAWLGWKIESNWTDPRIYLLYAVLRPVAGAMILVFMYIAVTHGARGPILGYLIVGTAFWPFVLAGVRGVVLGVLEDREQHQTAAALRTSPMPYSGYLIGRCLAQMATVGAVSTVVTLIIGRFGLGVRYVWSLPRALALIGGLTAGLVGVVALGIISVGLAINMSGESWNMPEGITAALYLVTGAIYPIAILPGWLAAIAKALPMTWWFESMRRALLPSGVPSSLPGVSNGGLAAGLIAQTIIWTTLAWVVTRYAERRARMFGLLDARSGY